MAIPHGLANGDDVRNYALVFESPKLSRSPESNLNFIGNAHPARLPNMFVHVLEIITGQQNLSPATDHRFTNESCDASLRIVRLLNQILNIVSVQLANLIFSVFISVVFSPKRARQRRLFQLDKVESSLRDDQCT